jgi:hypothetical protein
MNETATESGAAQAESIALEVIPPSSLEAITRGEVDVQVATAHRYPRSIVQFQRRALEMVTLDEETAASCIYCRPVGRKKDEKTGKWVEEYAKGLSVRTAEIVGACYGNLRVGAMVVEQTERYVKARGFAHDLESNFASTSEVIESTVTKDGKPFSERMRVVVAKACVAKARRDATFQVVPKALCKALEEAARKVAIGDATTLGQRRSAVMAWIAQLGVPAERVFAVLGVNGESEIGLDQLETLRGIKTAIKDGELKVDDAFPEANEGTAPKPNIGKGEAKKDKPAARKEEPPKPADPPPSEEKTPHQKLAQVAADCAITEKALMAWIRKNNVADCQLISQLDADEAEKALAQWSFIQAELTA